MNDSPETIARLQAYPKCAKLLETFTKTVIDSKRKRTNDEFTENYATLAHAMKGWTETVELSKHPEKAPATLYLRNPVDSFAEYVHSVELQEKTVNLYKFLNYDPATAPVIEPPVDSACAQFNIKWTFAVYVLRWMVAEDTTIDPYYKDKIKHHVPNLGVLSEIEATYAVYDDIGVLSVVEAAYAAYDDMQVDKQVPLPPPATAPTNAKPTWDYETIARL
jgi:hypothetical protein